MKFKITAPVNVPVLKRHNVIKDTFGSKWVACVSSIKFIVPLICAQTAKPVTGTAAVLISHHRFQFVIRIFLLASIKQIAIHKRANAIGNVQVICVQMENPGTLLIVAALMSVLVRTAETWLEKTVLAGCVMHFHALMDLSGTPYHVSVRTRLSLSLSLSLSRSRNVPTIVLKTKNKITQPANAHALQWLLVKRVTFGTRRLAVVFFKLSLINRRYIFVTHSIVLMDCNGTPHSVCVLHLLQSNVLVQIALEEGDATL